MKAFVFLLTSLFLAIVNSQQRPSLLSYRQRYPNDDESKVCGRIRDVIPRNSGRYRKILIRNTNNDAEYANDDCRRMTARAKSKMDTLASRTRENWPGVRVRVMQAWTDQVDPNDRTSLHYEGRSLRLQTSDGDRRKLDRLAGLALEAGFDWVEYTNYYYIRASVIPDVCQTSVDLVFLLDGSGSVGPGNFQKVKEFVKKVVDFFNIGQSGTHIAVVQYSTNTVTEFSLKRYFTKSEMKRAVDRIPYQGGWTYTAEALKFLRSNIFTKQAGMRADAGIPKVLVLLTDGHSQGDAVGPPARELKKIGISIFSIGVGSGVSNQQLKEIASDPDSEYVFQRTFDNLIAGWVDRLSAVSCSEGSLINSCDEAVTSVESGSFKYFRTQFQFVTGNQVSVELRDRTGISHLYASAKSKNPGPLDPDSVKNEKDTSPKAVSVRVDSAKTVFVAVQGQLDTNSFSLSFWDNLFSQTNYRVNVVENKAAHSIILLKMATNNKRLRYKITDGNGEGSFRIDSSSPRIYTTKSLDREKTEKYYLVIVAENEGNKCHKSRTNVVVIVGDENDNSPKFTENPYTARVYENAQIGSVVKTVKATDADSGANGRITYRITSPGDTFQINTQGQITLRKRLDYETVVSYTVNLEAADGGNKKATSKLLVTVLNINEPPSLRCNNANCKYSVNENSAQGTNFGAQMIGTDPDTRPSCNLQYILPSSVKSKFRIEANGFMRTNGALDRESKPQYRFLVTVRDCGGLSDDVYVTVNIGDENDNSPQFPGPYTVDILESEQPGSNVVQVNARDADENGNAKISYSITGAESSTFQIDAATGRITTKSKLDYEVKKLYQFQVVASDHGQDVRRGTTGVTVNVVDINDNKPIFGGPYSKEVPENSARGTRVITVIATDKDSGLRGEIRYSIVSGNIGNAFSVDGVSGLITVKSHLDRETRSSYLLIVQASDRGSPSMNTRATVTITIGDVNDNSPVFQGLPYTRSVPEDFSTTEVVLKVLATDKDAGSFGKVSYSIKSPSVAQQTFKIDVNGNIRLKKSLDYEKTKDYTLTIAARDGGNTETVSVKIYVEDVNDNTPKFEQDPYTGKVAENAKVGYVVGTVKAKDSDSGPRGRVSYSITAGNNGNAFRINAGGSVSVASALDREIKASYTLTIKAQDDGTQPKSSSARFIITVTDINDNKPTFQQNSYSFHIAENNKQNGLVGRMGLATDADTGVNAQIGYLIVSGNLNAAFEFQTNSGNLIAKRALDREQIASYSLVVEARDKGQPALYTRAPVEVIVLDKNDNDPKFTKGSYSCTIDENSAKNSRVCFVRATDADIGNNGKIVYELVSPSNEFTVSQNDGEIKAKISLDRETKALYTFDVKAKDRGDQPRSSIVTVTVKVIDKNDNEPRFNKSQYNFEVKEDASVGVKIDQVTASDADEGSSGQVVYTIIRGNVQSAFSINQGTGDISVKSKLDRETLANYKLTIRASDRGIPQQSSSKIVPIKILDVNDNAPIFTLQHYSGRIAEDAFVGSPVVQVKANDADEGVNSQIKYSINAGHNKEHFSIDEDSGLIKTATKLDYETTISYQLTVKATDQGTPTKSSNSTVNIEVKNTNDNAPTFVPGSPIVHISEAVAIGTKVVKFNATDQDGNKLAFSITKGNKNDAFKIDLDSGLLTTKATLDRETVPWYNLTVTVTESTNTRVKGQSTSQNLTVVVTDENDNGPVFDPKLYTKDIDENASAGVLLTVKATDKDVGKNAEISFSIDSTSTAKFSIDSKTGAVSTKAPLDHEETSRYVITVTARDSGTPSLSSTATVTVNVNDLNDNKPRFRDDYATTLRENTAKGRTVLRVEATDPDSEKNGEITYSITSGNKLGYFALDSTNGVITVAKPPDREQNPSFTLNVRAINTPPFAASTPAAKTDCTIVITIEDANDNRPVITNTVTSFQVEENSLANTKVLDVDATDEDDGVNREIEYEIVEGNVNDAFKINRRNGVISTKGPIDRETIDRYTLKVQVSDKGSPRLFSTKDFIVNVTDIDDNPPVFNPDSYEVSMLESANLSTPVVSLQATDKDIGISAKISFSITTGNDQDHFSLDPGSGVISTKAQLDYEKIKEYNLVVLAKDTKHTSEANVTIRVVNINDNRPVFKPKLYSVSIPENQALDKAIFTVTATDADPFGGLMFTIDPPSNMFTVDPADGQLSAVSELDRENTDYYKLTVRVTDGGTPALLDRAFVEINITDINDNSPKFNSSQLDISVRENSPIDKVLFTVAAADKDIGANAELRYRIAGGNQADKFKLDEVSGVLSVKGNIDREKVSAFRLVIMARDQGTPSLHSKPLVVAVNVLDENDNSPVFTKDRYEQNITENLSGGVFVKDLEATDADVGVNGRVTYAIVSGAEGYFRIDSDTGIIETTRPLDREHISLFKIKIAARDQGNPSRNSTAFLEVNVLDANDNPPKLDTVVANVTEEQPAGEFVTRILATDSDQGTNGKVEYSLTIRGSQSLRIDRKTGVVTTRVKFDYEEQKNHTFKIIATDKGNPSLSTTADLIINVLDIDDNCPVFDPKEYNVTIEENLPFLTDIVQVFATDVDTVGGNLEYGIRSGNTKETFRIDETSGMVKAGYSVDREIAPEYNLIVRAGNDFCGVNLTGPDIDESSGTQLSKSIAHVNIFLTDQNDNAPVFLQDSYQYELTDVFTESLLWLNATDPDEGVNAEFDFALAGVTRIRSKRTLVVTATDKGTPPMTSNTIVNVTGIKCEAMHFSVSTRGHLTVKTLCEFDKVVVPKDAFVGQSATFNCSAQGNTVPEYRWYRNSVPVTDWLKKGEYKIKTLTKNDEGQYSCIAASEAGNMFSEGHQFRVKEPAKVTVHPKDVWVEVGKKANLSCRASGDQPIKYSWFKNDIIIHSSADVNADRADLVFEKTIPEDEEVYHCEVSNFPDAKAGKSKTARLEVYTADAVVELELTVNKPNHKESCQYFNMTNIEETVEGMINGEMAVVEFIKPSSTCNLTACSSDPCLNNGRCEPKGSDFKCLCPREWTGKQCQIDVNECKTESCDNNGTCVNRKGSFYCDCPKSTKGKLCQFTNNICNPNPCAQGKCYPKEWKQGYECLDEVRTVSMVFQLDGARIPFKDWMLYDVAKEIENGINDAAVIQTRDGGRSRRDTTTVDYSGCSVRVTQAAARNTELDLQIMFVCTQPPGKKYVCDAMFNQKKVTSCTDENGLREAKPTTAPPTIAPQRVTLAFIVRNANGKDMLATETISVLKKGNFDDELNKYSISDTALRARSVNKGESVEQNTGISSGAITGVAVGVVVLIILVIVAALLTIRSRHRSGKQFSIGGRAILSRTQSSDAIVNKREINMREISMRELENTEARGVKNKTFSEIYEEHDGHPHDLEDGSFMVENAQLALRKRDQEYMKELESSPWFHGSISRSKAEDMLEATGNEGTFLVRSGFDMGEFYLSVRTPNAEPKFRHISVNRRGDDFVAVCGPNAEARNFTTFNELVEYLRENPTHIEGVSQDVLLKDHIAKV